MRRANRPYRLSLLYLRLPLRGDSGPSAESGPSCWPNHTRVRERERKRYARRFSVAGSSRKQFYVAGAAANHSAQRKPTLYRHLYYQNRARLDGRRLGFHGFTPHTKREYRCFTSKKKVPSLQSAHSARTADHDPDRPGSAGAGETDHNQEWFVANDADEERVPVGDDRGSHHEHNPPTGSCEEQWTRVDGLVRGLAAFIEDKGNLQRVVTRYTQSLVQAVLALNRTKKGLEPARPSTADKAVGTPPMFAGAVSNKRPAHSPPATRAAPKRHTAMAASRKLDENNNEADDQDGFSLVDRRRQRQRSQPAAADESARTRQQPKSRPTTRKVHHRPDAIVIRAKDASTYANILCKLRSEQTLQQSVGSSVQSIRRSAADALVLQLRKDIDNASYLGAEVGRVLEVVKTLRKAYAGTQVAVAALPDDLAAKALKLSHIRIGWVNCRIRGREDALRCYRCWSPGHVSARCTGPDRSAHCFRCGQAGHRIKDCKNSPVCVFCQEQGAAHDHASTGCASTWRIKVLVLCDQYKNLDPPYWLSDANSQAAIWAHGGCLVQERPARARPFFTWARINGIYFFSVYAPPRLADAEFSALLTNIIEEAWGKRPLIVAGDFNAWSTEWGCRETRRRVTALLDAFAALEAVLLNTGDMPTFTGPLGYSVIDLTFASDTLAPQITSWAVSELYTHSDHQAIVFEIKTARPPRPSTRKSCKWNARTLDTECLSVMMAGTAVPPGPAEEMATSLMAAITGACDASMTKRGGRRHRGAVYWWKSEIADLRRSCLRARRLAQRAPGRPNEDACRASYASARRLLRAAIKTSKRLC
ncbi:unnamed protein product [Trichogramma brassicae]|uniref:CCHC-type domain-containing protein n=1 Tax=Trichogramma brassicae TaxID=86971 RepID=A0A6H5IS50_9HYME|nr:unnamed protein product [Trichogramma brassicae]